MGLLLSHRTFARLWSAGLFFLLAWWALHAVMLIHVFDLTGSPFATGLIPVFSAIPGIVFGPIAGVLVDRWSRQRVMIWSAALLVMLMVAAMPLAGPLGVSLLFAIIFIQALVMTFFSPAENALLPTLVPDTRLGEANSLNALNDSLGRIVGPAVGAWLLVHQGFVATLAITAVLYLAGWLMLVGLPLEPGMARAEPDRRVGSLPRVIWGSFRAGLRDVRLRPMLMLLVAVSSLFMVADVPMSAVLPAFMQASVGVSPDLFGALMSVRGITGLLGGVVVVVLSRRVAPSHLLAGGLLVHGMSFATMGIANNLAASVLVLIPIGPAAAAIQTGLFTMLQQAAPDAMRGRVFALIGTINGLTVLVVSLLAGSLAEVYGTRVVVIAAGCLHLLPLVLAMTIVMRTHSHARAT